MQSEYETLASTVKKTLANFQSKKDFLVEQQHYYAVIRDKLTALQSKGKGSSDEDNSEKGEIFGDIIISANKVFLNLGYEYYVEKSAEEALDFVLDKLQLMDDAVVQFDAKIDEANNTLRNLKAMVEHAPQGSVVPRKPTEKAAHPGDDDYADVSLPTMEIREELDEEGNVVSGSVVPAATEKDRKQIEDILENKIARKVEAGVSSKTEVPAKGNEKFDASFEQSLKKNVQKIEDVSHSTASKSDEAAENSAHKIDTPDVSGETANNGARQVDTSTLYTFDDLVAQMDMIDAEEDEEEFDPEEADYDYDSYKGIDSHGYIEDEDEEYDFSDDDIAYQKMPGHSSLMDQINKLRAARGQQYPSAEHPDERAVAAGIVESVNDTVTETVMEKAQSTTSSASTSAPEKSILKKEKSTKPKKSVGFAASLDVHEVESFKEETKKQTFNFPRRGGDLYSMVQDMMTDDTNNPKLHEFDSDLFASLIGAKTSEELHDKYQVESGERGVGGDDDDDQKPGVRKPRVSRFKKEKRSRTNVSANSNKLEEGSVNSPAVAEKTAEPGRAVADLIVERDVVADEPVKESEQPVKAVADVIVEREVDNEDVPAAPKKRVSKFAQRKAKPPQNTTSVTSDIIERSVSDEPSQTKTPSRFKKSMGSLSKPRPHRKTQKPFPKELMDDSSDEGEEGQTPANPAQQPQPPKIEELGDVETAQAEPKSSENTDVIPQEIQAAIAEAGKTEESVRVANVDYSALVDNMDDMVQAYSLGAYDDDLEEHPGTVVEHVEDFAAYNHQVNELRDDILEFKKNHPMVPMDAQGADDDDNNDDDDDSTPGVMTDVVEKDIPADYRDIEEGYEGNLGLLPDNLAQAVNEEYRSLRTKMVGMMRDMSLNENNVLAAGATPATAAPQAADPSIEPLDAEGNPVRVSRFKSQRRNLYPQQSHIAESG